MAALRVGFDIGGTWARAVLVGPEGEVRRSARIKHGIGAGNVGSSQVATLLDWMTEAAGEPRAAARAESPSRPKPVGAKPVGLAVAGIVSGDGGAILRAVHLQPLEGADFVKQLSTRLRRPVRLFTDAHAATWAEYAALPPPRPARFVHLRLGTGVALGEVCDGRYAAPQRRGHHHPDLLIVDDGAGAPCCPCGLTGCLEAYVARAGSAGGATFDAGRALRTVIDRIGDYLTAGRATGDAVIVIGGGRTRDRALMSAAGIDLGPGQVQWRPGVALAPARLGDAAAAAGAALLTA